MAEKHPNPEGEYKEPDKEKEKPKDLTPSEKELEDLLRRSKEDSQVLKHLEVEKAVSDFKNRQREQDQDFKDREQALRERTQLFRLKMVLGTALICIGTIVAVLAAFGVAVYGVIGLALASIGATILGVKKSDKPISTINKWTDQ